MTCPLRSRTALLATLVILIAAIAGCGTMQAQQRLEVLEASVRSFAKLLRWGYYEEAAQYLATPDGRPIAVNLAGLEDIRITSFDVVHRQVSDDQLDADIQVNIGYYHQESGVLHTLTEHQHWWFSTERKRWLLDGTIPDFISALRAER